MHQSPHHNAELLLPLSFLSVWEMLVVSCGSRTPQGPQFLSAWELAFWGSHLPLNLLSALPEWEKVLAEGAAELLLCVLLTRAYRAAQIIHSSVALLEIKIISKIFTMSASNFSWKRTFTEKWTFKVSVLKLRRLLSTNSCRWWILLLFHVEIFISNPI